MKKQKLKSLALNKKKVSNLKKEDIKGGTNPISLLLGGGSWCVCK